MLLVILVIHVSSCAIRNALLCIRPMVASFHINKVVNVLTVHRHSRGWGMVGSFRSLNLYSLFAYAVHNLILRQ